MDIQYILIGILQGLLEWLPVSSSGQIAIFYSRILGLDPLEGYRIGLAAHIGTALSAIVYFRGELKSILTRDKGNTWLRVLTIPSLSAAPVGYIIYLYIVGWGAPFLELLTGIALIITGLILYIFGRYGFRVAEDLRIKELVFVGLIEGLTIIPGLSRSALTIAALSILGLNSEDTIRASFIMAIPVTVSAGLFQLVGSDIVSMNEFYEASKLLISSFLTGLATIGLITSIAKKFRS
ncbi:TPA: undecaprenyl-diphosphate phosphatase, partial [Candidatus Geothermarchaeota archaeon]|nr:undecaprenyl-diphosphate phosphatase [Candidatus Geothermarchaeota archaeon]